MQNRRYIHITNETLRYAQGDAVDNVILSVSEESRLLRGLMPLSTSLAGIRKGDQEPVLTPFGDGGLRIEYDRLCVEQTSWLAAQRPGQIARNSL